MSEKFQQDKKTSYILEIKIKDEVKGNESMKKNGGGKIKKDRELRNVKNENDLQEWWVEGRARLHVLTSTNQT